MRKMDNSMVGEFYQPIFVCVVIPVICKVKEYIRFGGKYVAVRRKRLLAESI